MAVGSKIMDSVLVPTYMHLSGVYKHRSGATQNLYESDNESNSESHNSGSESDEHHEKSESSSLIPRQYTFVAGALAMRALGPSWRNEDGMIYGSGEK